MRAFVVVSQHCHVMVSSRLHAECHHGHAGCTLEADCAVKQAHSATLCGFNAHPPEYPRTQGSIMSGPDALQCSTPCVVPLTTNQVIHPVNMLSEKRDDLPELYPAQHNLGPRPWTPKCALEYSEIAVALPRVKVPARRTAGKAVPEIFIIAPDTRLI